MTPPPSNRANAILLCQALRSSEGLVRPPERSSGPQPPGKTEFVTVRIGQVKKALAPFGIARRGVGPAAGSDQSGIERVDLGDVKDQASPPGPPALGPLGEEGEKNGSGAKTREFRLFAAIEQLKPHHP